MAHPGEQFYPQGVRWDDVIAQGTLPDLMAKAAAQYGARPAIEFRDRPISYAELESMVETAAAGFLRAGYGKNSSVALFLGNSPDHPVNFFGALKAGSRIVHLSPLDGERALAHKLTDSGARVLVTSDLATLLPTALKFLEKGLLDRLIVCEDDHWGAVGNPHAPIPDHPAIVTFREFAEGASKPAQWPKLSVDDVALLQYTGGTTGLPKGAMLRCLGQGGAVQPRRDRARDLRPAAVSHFRADGDPAAQPGARRPDFAAPTFRRRSGDARYRSQAGHRVSRRPHHVDCDREPARSGKP
jgi:long-chain acyl-CoA synthetase